MRVWDAASQVELAAFEQPAGTYYLATSPTGDLVATCVGASVFVWDIEARTKVHELTGHAKTVLAANFSPGGARIVSTARARTSSIPTTSTSTPRGSAC